MSIKTGSLSIVLVGTATLSLMLAGHPFAQYAGGEKSTQKPSGTQTPPSGTQPKPSGTQTTMSKAAGGVSAADKKFLTDTVQGGEAEVELAKLAQQKAADAQVKTFAERMESDHSKANSELQALLAQKSVTVAGGLGPHMALKNRLDKLQGATFDTAYMRAMVDDHTKTVRAFETESKTTKDADIKAFVDKTLPTLREHLKMAQDTNKGVSSTLRTPSATPTATGGTSKPTQGGTSTPGTSNPTPGTSNPAPGTSKPTPK